jgi:hypothetical protein
VRTWEQFRQAFAHAFALALAGQPLSSEEATLLEKVADVIVRRDMTAPALLFLESLGPLTFLGSQVGHGMRPFLELFCDATEMERLATLLERRDSIDQLIVLIQERTAASA